MKKNIILSFIILLIAATNCFAQGVFTYHFGPSFPSGKFADDDYDDWWENTGGAGIGGVIGIKYLYPVNTTGLSLFAGIDATIYGLNTDLRDEIEQEKPDVVSIPKYLSFPISGGINYRYNVNDKFALYGEGGIAAGILKITNYLEDVDDLEWKRTFDVTINPGYKIGVGIILNNKIEIGLTHFNLGKYSVDNEVNYDHDVIRRDNIHVRVEYTMLTLGFYL